MPRIFLLAAVAAFGFSMPAYAAQTPRDQTSIIVRVAAKVNTACCRAQYSRCSAFCRANPTRDGCTSDCDSRLSRCNSTGIFTWNNSADVSCR